MALPFDRAQISIMHGGPSNYNRESVQGGRAGTRAAAFTSDNPNNLWTKPPTQILVPSNDYRGAQSHRESAPTSTNTINPFNRTSRKNANNTRAGNLTASKTVAATARTSTFNTAPPNKRQKVEHAPWSSSTGDPGPSRVPPRPRLPKAPLAQEPPPSREIIIVEDVEDSLQDLSSPQREPSSDPLNIHNHFEGTSSSWPSKYQFNAERRMDPHIVPDTPVTQQMESKYDLSDDIQDFDDFDDRKIELPKSSVKQIVQNIEKSNKVDFREVQMEKRKGLKQGMKAKKTTALDFKTQVTDQDPIATSSTAYVQNSRKPATKPDSMPVAVASIGDDHYASTPHSKITVSINRISNSLVVMDGNNKRLFQHLPHEYVFFYGGTYEVASNPDFQFQPTGLRKNDPLITFCLDTSDPDWDLKQYEAFVAAIKRMRLEIEIVTPSKTLWGVAEMDETEEKASKKKPDRNAELKEIEERKKRDRQLGPPATHPSILSAPSETLRYTPPDPPLKLKPKEIETKRGASKEGKTSAARTRSTATDPGATYSARRTTRSQIASARGEDARPLPKKRPRVDADEVILAYPQGLPGAVTVTNGDLERLEPGEFLNDTLIEFGLKLWLKELESSNPELAEQVHVFNSFFYKKLNGHKDPQQSYESVRKWTSKFDLFKKKYIIVPINEHLHWYLAIIYQPEHALTAQPTKPQSTRPHTRLSTTKAVEAIEHTPAITEQPTGDSNSSSHADYDIPGSEAEVERSLQDFQSSCTIGEGDGEGDNDKAMDSSSKEDDDHSDIYGDPYIPEASSPLTEVNDEEVCAYSPTASDTVKEAELRQKNSPSNSPSHAPSPTDAMAVDDVEDEVGSAETPMEAAKTPVNEPIPAASFYAPLPKSKGKRKAEVDPDVIPIDVDPPEEDIIEVHDVPKTHIFTFDSLGSRHPQAIKKLSAYLQLEAKDKKQIDNASLASGKAALVPTQPNFCDCGVYLLHFAKTFMNDPKKYADAILFTKSKGMSNKERQAVWDHELVGEMREDLSQRITNMSEEWKKAREEAKRQESAEVTTIEESDMECEVVGSNMPPKKPRGGTGGRTTTTQQKAKRIRG